MNRKEVAALVAYVTQLVPAQQFDDYTALAWHDVLGDVPATFEQAREAAARVAKKQQWIYPSVIRGELMAIMPPRQHSNPAQALEAPSKFETYEDRSERIARNKAKVQVVLDAVAAKKVTEDPHEANIPETLRRAREMARQYKRERDAKPAPSPRPLADTIPSDPAVMVERFKQVPERTAE